MSLIQAFAPKAFLIVIQIVPPPIPVPNYQSYNSVEECRKSSTFEWAKWLAEVEVVCVEQIPDNLPVALGSSYAFR